MTNKTPASKAAATPELDSHKLGQLTQLAEMLTSHNTRGIQVFTGANQDTKHFEHLGTRIISFEHNGRIYWSMNSYFTNGAYGIVVRSADGGALPDGILYKKGHWGHISDYFEFHHYGFGERIKMEGDVANGSQVREMVGYIRDVDEQVRDQSDGCIWITPEETIGIVDAFSPTAEHTPTGTEVSGIGQAF